MKTIIIIGSCIAFCILVEVVYNIYISKLPENIREKMEKPSEMRCSNCGSKDFEMVGYHGKFKFQCKYCKKIK